MPKTNADLAAAFEQTADLLELQQANPFRVRAYREAAAATAGSSSPANGARTLFAA